MCMLKKLFKIIRYIQDICSLFNDIFFFNSVQYDDIFCKKIHSDLYHLH